MRRLHCRLFHDHDRALDRTADQITRQHDVHATDALAAWAQARDPFPAATYMPTAATRRSAAERDRRGSRRTLLAAALIRRGDDLHRIAEITGVPVALLELIRDEPDPVIHRWLAPGTLDPNQPEPVHPDRDRETDPDS